MDRGAWQATVHGVAKNRTRLSDWAHLQDLSSPSRGWICAPAVAAWSPNHRATREALKVYILTMKDGSIFSSSPLLKYPQSLINISDLTQFRKAFDFPLPWPTHPRLQQLCKWHHQPSRCLYQKPKSHSWFLYPSHKITHGLPADSTSRTYPELADFSSPPYPVSIPSPIFRLYLLSLDYAIIFHQDTAKSLLTTTLVAFVYKHSHIGLFVTQFIFLGKHLHVRLVNCMVSTCLILSETTQLISILHSHQ